MPRSQAEGVRYPPAGRRNTPPSSPAARLAVMPSPAGSDDARQHARKARSALCLGLTGEHRRAVSLDMLGGLCFMYRSPHAPLDRGWYRQADREADTPRRGWFSTMYCETPRAGRRSHGGPCCRAKQAAQAAEVIVKITGPSAKIAIAMATMATAMATTSAKPSMRGVLGLLIAFNNIARRHMHAGAARNRCRDLIPPADRTNRGPWRCSHERGATSSLRRALG